MREDRGLCASDPQPSASECTGTRRGPDDPGRRRPAPQRAGLHRGRHVDGGSDRTTCENFCHDLV